MIYVVGLGPGNAQGQTFAARQAMAGCDALVGYRAYIDLVRAQFPDKPVFSTGMGGEAARCRQALRLAGEGKRVCLLCSGDAAVYGMASLVLELAGPEQAVEVIPGVTAALSASAALGAPLGGDFACVSLSDLITPWAVIEKRLTGAALGDFCLALYNPGSAHRPQALWRACQVLLRHLPQERPCGWARNLGRPGQAVRLCTLGQLQEEKVDMFTTVIVGNSATCLRAGRLITPRGYAL